MLGGKLLILGAPGAGKTTLLLELARDLLERAERDDTLPIPVIFSLSSWANKQANLPDWFVEESNLKYGVPEKVGRTWVQDEQLLPLLDGLDQRQRSACAAAINAYQQRQGYGLAPLALTSRAEAYQAVSPRVFLHTAVIVQPLTPAQIDAYLSSARGRLEGVRIALQDNPDLQALALPGEQDPREDQLEREWRRPRRRGKHAERRGTCEKLSANKPKPPTRLNARISTSKFWHCESRTLL